MNKLILLTMLAFLVACSSGKKGKVPEAAFDSLAQETTKSWGQERLAHSMAKDKTVMGCFQGEVKETLAQYKSQYDKRDANPYYWLHIGNCYYISADEEKAQFFFQMALEEGKSAEIKSMAVNNLGLLALKNRQWDEGRFHLKDAIKLNPKLRVAKYNLSQLYLQFGHYDEALALLKSDEGNSQDADYHFSMANGHLFKGDLEKASLHFKKIPSDHFKREDYAITYSLFLVKKGDLKNAQKVLEGRNPGSVDELKKISSKLETLIERRMKK